MLEGGSRHVCCVQARDKTCDPAPRGVLDGGIRRVFLPPARLLCPSTRPAAVSKHETGLVTKQTTGTRGGGVRGGGSSPGTAAVSKHETSTVTKQTTGGVQFMVAFSLRGGGFKKSQNTPRPSEHPPVMGGKMSKRFGGIKGCKYKTSSWHLNRFPDVDNNRQYNVGEKPTVILYIYINRHAGTPEKH